MSSNETSKNTISKDKHDPVFEDSGQLSHYQIMEIAVRELLIEKQILTANQFRSAVESMDSRSPEGGARVVVKAWKDPMFKKELLNDGNNACKSIGLDLGPTNLLVVENTPDIHNVIVCTLCSCYPRMLLGIPPDWYKSPSYRARVVKEPRSVLSEFGTKIPEDIVVRVHDSTADMRYLVLPMQPIGSEKMNDSQLTELVTRDCMIGVTIPRATSE